MGPVSDVVADAKAWWKSKTFIGTILMVLPVIIKMIKPDLALDLAAGTEEVFTQATQVAQQADAMWVTLSQSIGAILTAVGIRTAKSPVKGF